MSSVGQDLPHTYWIFPSGREVGRHVGESKQARRTLQQRGGGRIGGLQAGEASLLPSAPKSLPSCRAIFHCSASSQEAEHKKPLLRYSQERATTATS